MKKKVVLIVTLILLITSSLILFSQNKISEKTSEEFPVYISINCNTVFSNMDKLDYSLKTSGYIPQDGVILEKTTLFIKEGDSVLDALRKVTKEYDIQLEYTQSPNDAYVEGINYLYEFSCGPLSGWMYTVNSVAANKGCDAYYPSKGDVIEWIYTCDLGKDIGNEF